MNLLIKEYTRDRVPDVLDFERRLREEEVFGVEKLMMPIFKLVKKF